MPMAEERPSKNSVRTRTARVALFLWLLLVSSPAGAQRILPDIRPGDERQTLPPFEAQDQPDDGPILPPYSFDEDDGSDSLLRGTEIEIQDIVIEGNTVIASSVLEEIAKPFEGRRLSLADLEVLRDQLTAAYLDRGYATSGAELPDQVVHGGVLRINIVEGRLSAVEVRVRGRYRPDYFKDRITHSQKGILNVLSLQEQLQIFQQDPQIESITAHLEPASARGFSRLELTVNEAPFGGLGLSFDNYRSPAIGSLAGTVYGNLHNVVGIGDAAHIRFTGRSSLRQLDAGVEAPINVWDTRLGVRYQSSQGSVVDPSFAALGIQSESTSVSLALSQPLYRTPQTNIEGHISADWRRAQSFLFGGAIGFPTLYAEDGRSDVTALRFGLDLFYRSRNQSVAMRSLLSWGIDALGATVNPGDIPDGRFVAWLGQFQWAGRLPWLGAQLLARTDVQLSPDSLLPMEQFAVGGRYSVRGYRENLLVRDNGLTATLEFRVPIFQLNKPGLRVELAPFADFGRSWNNSRPVNLGNQAEPITIGSVGIGLRGIANNWGTAEIYWGHRLKEIRSIGESDAQDDGISFRLSLHWP
jgi:hemolysin activation/secretion protein